MLPTAPCPTSAIEARFVPHVAAVTVMLDVADAWAAEVGVKPKLAPRLPPTPTVCAAVDPESVNTGIDGAPMATIAGALPVFMRVIPRTAAACFPSVEGELTEAPPV